MDDFGTGYPSLSSLQAPPVDAIEIDQTFVVNLDRNPHSAAIVSAFAGLVHGLAVGISVARRMQPRCRDTKSTFSKSGRRFCVRTCALSGRLTGIYSA